MAEVRWANSLAGLPARLRRLCFVRGGVLGGTSRGLGGQAEEFSESQNLIAAASLT